MQDNALEDTLRTMKHLPIIKYIWSKIRERRILKSHKQVANFWQPIIQQYFNGNLPVDDVVALKPELIGKKIIWQYWGQGVEKDNLPEIVQICFASVDRHKGDYTVIRLNDNTINEYVKFPPYVHEKLGTGDFNRTFFSDLLRLALLKGYGGVWMDATIFLTGDLPPLMTDADYFVYQRDDQEERQDYWQSTYAAYWGWHPKFKVRMLNSIFFAKPQSKMIATLLDLMLYFWKTQTRITEYFFFQILYNELVSNKMKAYQCPLVSDVHPHYLQSKVNGGSRFIDYPTILNTSNIHNMSYFNDAAMNELKTQVLKYQ